MKGLELARAFYDEFGAQMIKEGFPELESVIAVGLVGSGSECFGYDDDLSADHDFEAGFCMFIPDEDVIDSRTAFRLERAYAKLPKEFMGYRRSVLDPVGGNRHGVIRISDFYRTRVGRGDGLLTDIERLSIPDSYFAEATNGEVFRDDYGLFTSIRERLKVIPENVRLKKLAGALLTMAQAGQYNYMRCVRRGETAAAQLAVFEFANAAIDAVFALNGKYRPFYKWVFRALRGLDTAGDIAGELERLITTPNDGETAEGKCIIIEDISARIIEELKAQGLTSATCGDLEKHAYSVNDRISDPNLRNESVLFAR